MHAKSALFNQLRTQLTMGCRRRLPEKAPRPSHLPIIGNQWVFELAGFLLGIGHESPLQQHDAGPFLPLQQAWAFLPRLVFLLQQDIAPPLQQFSMSQQASEFWLVFCGGFRVRAPAETAKAPAQAKLIKSTLTFLIIVTPIQRIAGRNKASH